MQDTEEINPDYLKGFNQGYLLSQHDPELAKQLGKAMPESERGNGFRNGISEHSKEKQEMKRPIWLKENRLTSDRSILPEKLKDEDKGLEKE